jgi:hypothetical protein
MIKNQRECILPMGFSLAKIGPWSWAVSVTSPGALAPECFGSSASGTSLSGVSIVLITKKNKVVANYHFVSLN